MALYICLGFNGRKAMQLKKAGLNGIAISLDHHLEEEHNRFQSNSRSYQWVMEGVKNSKAAGIFASFNVCPTKAYVGSNSF